MRRDEITTVFTQLDKLFGRHYANGMFKMYGLYNHELDILFNNNTVTLSTEDILNSDLYNIPFNFERSLNLTHDSCQVTDTMTASGSRMTSTVLLLPVVMYTLFR